MSSEDSLPALEKVMLLSREPFGLSIAKKIASKLECSHGLKYFGNQHRDYCGHGLICDNGVFCVAEISDGLPHSKNPFQKWETKKEFVNWLAAQSDYSMCGADPKQQVIRQGIPRFINNQTITKERLESFASSNIQPHTA